MLSIIEAAGWPIWTIILASVLSLAIIFERFYSLRQSLVAPAGLLEDVLTRLRAGESRNLAEQLANGAPLARIQRQLKAAFDPDGVFNPGRLYPWV